VWVGDRQRHTVDKLIGQCDRLKRSLIFENFCLEQGAEQLSISPTSAVPVKV
jgi:hypothetical protein